MPEFVIDDGRIIDVKDFGSRGLPHAQVLNPMPVGTDIGQGAEHAGVKVPEIRNRRAGSGMAGGTESVSERIEETDVDGLGGFCHGATFIETSIK
jgi:hypothetical protein